MARKIMCGRTEDRELKASHKQRSSAVNNIFSSAKRCSLSMSFLSHLTSRDLKITKTKSTPPHNKSKQGFGKNNAPNNSVHAVFVSF
jgi:hypothetical protein